tara:strand:- start:30686 stop:31078 length:393 start_codon:yes stop_codon:yes gene_type:complete
MTIDTPISYGEAIDKLTILEIKKVNISQKNQLENILNEHSLLTANLDKLKIENKNAFENFYEELLKVNSALWKVEDRLRIFEKDKIFNEEFISLARSVYKLNDQRYEIKKQINTYFESDIFEEKKYEDYQ